MRLPPERVSQIPGRELFNHCTSDLGVFHEAAKLAQWWLLYTYNAGRRYAGELTSIGYMQPNRQLEPRSEVKKVQVRCPAKMTGNWVSLLV